MGGFGVEVPAVRLKILERGKNVLKLEVEGEGHTFCNLLQKALLEDEGVEAAGYDIPHPLISIPIIYVRTSGKRKPEDALRDAVKRISELNDEFREALIRALEGEHEEK